MAGITIDELTELTSPTETTNFLVGGGNAQKMKLSTLFNWIKEKLGGKISYTDINLILPNRTWTKSAAGMYYSEDIDVESITGATIGTILSVTLLQFGSINETDCITPAIAYSNNKKIRILSNTNTFAHASFFMIFRVVYREP